jgi:hypothetical protein
MAKVADAVLQILPANAPKKNAKKKKKCKRVKEGIKRRKEFRITVHFCYIQKRSAFSHHLRTILLSALFNKCGNGQ